MFTYKNLFDLLHSFYGARLLSQKDLADIFGISRRDVCMLARAAGYSRGKLVRTVKLADFEHKTGVKLIYYKIKANVDRTT